MDTAPFMNKILFGLLFVSLGLNVAFLIRSEVIPGDITESILDTSGLPSITLTFDGERYGEPTRGSYCWDGMCADTIGPPEIWTGRTPFEIPWQEVSTRSGAFELVSDVPLLDIANDGIAVGMMSEDGTRLTCATQVKKIDDTHFTGEFCVDPGSRVIVDIMIRPTAGGDVSFYYPLQF